jgi:hypothetical protein
VIALSPRARVNAAALTCAYLIAHGAIARAQTAAPVGVPPAAAPSAPAKAAAPSAGPAASEPPGYRAAVDAAISEHEAGHFAESRALFARANALFPNARTLRGLGMAEFELRNYDGSVDYLQRALASTIKPLEGELRTETEKLLARARGFVGRFRLTFQPSNASLTLDGTLVPPSDATALVLSVGDHQLQVSADGYTSEQRSLRVTGGEDATLEFVLLQPTVSGPVAATTAPTPAAEPSRSVLASPWLWVAVGAVAIGAGVGIGVAAASSGGAHVADANGGNTGVVLKGP